MSDKSHSPGDQDPRDVAQKLNELKDNIFGKLQSAVQQVAESDAATAVKDKIDKVSESPQVQEIKKRAKRTQSELLQMDAAAFLNRGEAPKTGRKRRARRDDMPRGRSSGPRPVQEIESQEHQQPEEQVVGESTPERFSIASPTNRNEGGTIIQEEADTSLWDFPSFIRGWNNPTQEQPDLGVGDPNIPDPTSVPEGQHPEPGPSYQERAQQILKEYGLLNNTNSRTQEEGETIDVDAEEQGEAATSTPPPTWYESIFKMKDNVTTYVNSEHMPNVQLPQVDLDQFQVPNINYDGINVREWLPDINLEMPKATVPTYDYND